MDHRRLKRNPTLYTQRMRRRNGRMKLRLRLPGRQLNLSVEICRPPVSLSNWGTDHQAVLVALARQVSIRW
jgi:hypothetical protein